MLSPAIAPHTVSHLIDAKEPLLNPRNGSADQPPYKVIRAHRQAARFTERGNFSGRLSITAQSNGGGHDNVVAKAKYYLSQPKSAVHGSARDLHARVAIKLAISSVYNPGSVDEMLACPAFGSFTSFFGSCAC
jgi:hypothetical protein